MRTHEGHRVLLWAIIVVLNTRYMFKDEMPDALRAGLALLTLTLLVWACIWQFIIFAGNKKAAQR